MLNECDNIRSHTVLMRSPNRVASRIFGGGGNGGSYGGGYGPDTIYK